MKKILSLIGLLFIIAIPSSVSAQQYQNGIIITEDGDSRIYVIIHNQKYWIRTPEIFNSYKLDWSRILHVSSGMLSEYASVKIISPIDDEKVYYISGKQKRWISSLKAFEINEFNWQAVMPVNKIDFDLYDFGPNLNRKLGALAPASVSVEIIAPLSSSGTSDIPKNVDFSILWDVWKTIEQKFKGNNALDTKKMVQGAVDGVVRSLEDPYTVFLKPIQFKKFTEDVKGAFGGIGAQLGYKNGIVIIAPLAGMPAEKAGLQAGDRIIHVNGTSTIGMSIEDAVTNIRGKKATKVILGIERAGESNVLEFTIIRDIISIPSVKWEMKTNKVAYIKLNNFFGTIVQDFKHAVQEAQAAGMQKLILDLRGNPGGLFDAAITIASEFIPIGKVIVLQDFGLGKGSISHRSFGGLLETTPTIVLVDSGSASASEIVAGALKDIRNIQLVGEKTFGKGTVQELIPLSNGASIKVTIANWIRPSGIHIEKEGIAPDVVVQFTDTDRINGEDPQLKKAIELVNKL